MSQYVYIYIYIFSSTYSFLMCRLDEANQCELVDCWHDVVLLTRVIETCRHQLPPPLSDYISVCFCLGLLLFELF